MSILLLSAFSFLPLIYCPYFLSALSLFFILFIFPFIVLLAITLFSIKQPMHCGPTLCKSVHWTLGQPWVQCGVLVQLESAVKLKGKTTQTAAIQGSV